VKCEYPSGRIIDTFSAWAHPKINKKYGPGAKKLPDLALAKESGLDARDVLLAFAEWCGDETVFATWGPDDYSVLMENVARWKVDAVPMPEWYYDLQIAVCSSMGTNAQLSLELAVAYCGIPESFDYHNALYDSMYTALVGTYASGEALRASRRKPRFFGTPKDELDEMPVGVKEHIRKPGEPRGPFENAEKALNDRVNRKARCPYCQAPSTVEEWHTRDGNDHYTLFRCREHGHFVLRLTLGRDEAGALRSTAVVLDPTAENKKLLKAARQGVTIHCRGKRRRRRRRRRGTPKE